MEKLNNNLDTVTKTGLDVPEEKLVRMNTATTHGSNSAMGRLQNLGIFREDNTNLKQK